MDSVPKNPPVASDCAELPIRSLLSQFLEIIEAKSSMKISFEDLTGVTYDVPDFGLSGEHRYHICQFCEFAKQERRTLQDCIRNKRIVNRIAVRRRTGFSGQCHLGLTDLVEPLVYRERVIGIFYYGSVVVEGSEIEAKRRIQRYCSRKKLNPEPFLAQLEQAARLSSEEHATARERMQLVVQFAARLLDAFGLPLERYKTEKWVHEMNLRRKLPPIVQSAIRFIQIHYAEPIRLEQVALFARCNSDYLSRLFKRNMAFGLEEYVARVRVDHARRLLETERYSLGEIGYLVGFQDQTQFGRVFKRFTEHTPGSYRLSHRARTVLADEAHAIQFPPNPLGTSEPIKSVKI